MIAKRAFYLQSGDIVDVAVFPGSSILAEVASTTKTDGFVFVRFTDGTKTVYDCGETVAVKEQ